MHISHPYRHDLKLLLWKFYRFLPSILWIHCILSQTYLLEINASSVPKSPTPVIKIVGGVVIKIEDVPWMVQIRLMTKEACGGTLLNEQWILTAAHCFPGFRSTLYKVHLGRQYKYKEESGPLIRSVSKIIKHPDYDKAKRFDADIAVVKLDIKVPFSSKIHPAAYQKDVNALNSESYCCVAGWGQTMGYGKGDSLNQACIAIYDTKSCNDTRVYKGALTKNMFCGGFDEGGSDSCQGDSGGPLMCYYKDKWVLEGVTSWGEGCGKRPGVYAKISHYHEWITSTISRN